jgi:hypothetical protein
MTSFENIITPIIFNGGKNIYALGLCLNGGRIHKIKLWNKIYDNSSVYHDYLYSFGGEECLKYYSTTKEWKKTYPGFSGFATGVEFHYDANQKLIYNYGFGFKDLKEGVLTFNAFYLNEEREIISDEIYDYVVANDAQLVSNKMQTNYIEVKRLNPDTYCYCPKIEHNKNREIEHEIQCSLSEKNKEIFFYIKDLNKKYLILNYGVNPDYEKIYLVSEDNQNINNLFDLLKNVSHLIENSPLTVGSRSLKVKR